MNHNPHGLGAKPATDQQRLIPAQIQRFKTLTNELHAQLDSIEERLHPVIDHPRPETPGGCVEPKNPVETKPKLDEELRESNASLEQALGRISDIRDRLRF